MMAESVYKIAYDVACTTIALQHQALTNLRARAATIVAGSALVASFVGAPALRGGAHGFFVVAGLVAFVAVLSAAGLVLGLTRSNSGLTPGGCWIRTRLRLRLTSTACTRISPRDWQMRTQPTSK